jgi:antitoxin HicB
MRKNKHRGSDFRHFLEEEGIRAEVESKALKRSLAIQFEKALAQRALSKTEMAVRMKTSRAALDRLLDESNTSVTLNTLEKAAQALGRRLKIDLIPV